MASHKKQLINAFLSVALFIYITSNKVNNYHLLYTYTFLIFNLIYFYYYYVDEQFLFVKNSIISALLFFLLTGNETYEITNFELKDTVNKNVLNVKGITIYSAIYFILLLKLVHQ